MNILKEKKEEENTSFDIQSQLIQKMINIKKILESNSKYCLEGSLEYHFKKTEYFKNEKGYSYINDLKIIMNKLGLKKRSHTRYPYKLIYNESCIKNGIVTCNFNVDLGVEYNEANWYLLTSSSSSNNKRESFQIMEFGITKNHKIQVNMKTNIDKTLSYQLYFCIGDFWAISRKFTLYSFKQMKRIIKNYPRLEKNKNKIESILQFIGCGLLQSDNNYCMISKNPSFKMPIIVCDNQKICNFIVKNVKYRNSVPPFRNQHEYYGNYPPSVSDSFPIKNSFQNQSHFLNYSHPNVNVYPNANANANTNDQNSYFCLPENNNSSVTLQPNSDVLLAELYNNSVNASNGFPIIYFNGDQYYWIDPLINFQLNSYIQNLPEMQTIQTTICPNFYPMNYDNINNSNNYSISDYTQLKSIQH